MLMLSHYVASLWQSLHGVGGWISSADFLGVAVILFEVRRFELFVCVTLTVSLDIPKRENYTPN